MSDDSDLEERLRRTFRAMQLPTAPDALRVQLTELQARPVPARRRASRSWWILAVPLAAILILAFGSALGGGPSVSHRPSSATSGPSTDDLPTTVDGLPVTSVSAVLAARAAGQIHGEAIALGGYWSDGSVGHSCAAPQEQPGELEIYCHDGEWGITEKDEPILVISSHGVVTEPAGPHLTPWFPNDLPRLSELLSLPIINGQRYPPIPIVVIGHFDDARAAACRPTARQLCLDRLVVERIAVFLIASVPTPGVSPTPTPFPSPAPSGLFGPEACGGDVAYSFVGWTTTDQLQLPYQREGHVWAMVTAVPVLLGGEGWNDDPNGSGHKFRWWGRRICIGEEGQEGAVEYGAVPGTSYREWDDGRHTPGEP